jgi:hypothetical protein
MTRITKAELAKELADRDWWRVVAKALGMELSGWTYRSSALFRRPNGYQGFDCPGDVAEKIHELLRAAGAAPEETNP